MTKEIKRAVEYANEDPRVKCILISGANGCFCSGWDLKQYAEAKRGSNPGSQTMPWDPLIDYSFIKGTNDCFMSLFHSYKPTICKIEKYALGAGSDIALCCDLIFMEENSKIGYPPSTFWGCPTTAFWGYRVGVQKAKEILLTGRMVGAREAEK
eukprot:UN25208